MDSGLLGATWQNSVSEREQEAENKAWVTAPSVIKYLHKRTWVLLQNPDKNVSRVPVFVIPRLERGRLRLHGTQSPASLI